MRIPKKDFKGFISEVVSGYLGDKSGGTLDAKVSMALEKASRPFRPISQEEIDGWMGLAVNDPENLSWIADDVPERETIKITIWESIAKARGRVYYQYDEKEAKLRESIEQGEQSLLFTRIGQALANLGGGSAQSPQFIPGMLGRCRK